MVIAARVSPVATVTCAVVRKPENISPPPSTLVVFVGGGMVPHRLQPMQLRPGSRRIPALSRHIEVDQTVSDQIAGLRQLIVTVSRLCRLTVIVHDPYSPSRIYDAARTPR